MDWKYLFTSIEGRINRAKFWAGIGALVVVGIVALLIDMLIGTYNYQSGFGVISTIVMLISVYLAICLYAKRWHDRDKSGWWTLIGLVPIIGGIWLLIELGILEGTRGANRFGADPIG